MLECDVCHEWYHGKCLKISKKDVDDDDDSYVCPVCDWRQEIPRQSNRPLLEDMQALERDALDLPFVVAELEKVRSIVATAQAFRERLRPFFSTYISFTFAELPTLRFYLRKLEGGEVLLAAETNHFKAKVHELYPIAPTAPPIISESKSTRKPRMSKKKREELLAQGIDPATWRAPESVSTPVHVPQPVLEQEARDALLRLPQSAPDVAPVQSEAIKAEPSDRHIDRASPSRERSTPLPDSEDAKPHRYTSSAAGTPSLEAQTSRVQSSHEPTPEIQAQAAAHADGAYAIDVEVGNVFDPSAYTGQSGFRHDPDIAATLTGLRHTTDNPFASNQVHIPQGAEPLETDLSTAYDDAHVQQPNLLSSALKVGSDELRDFAASTHHGNDSVQHVDEGQGQLDEDGDFDMYLA